MNNLKKGENCIIGDNVEFGNNVTLGNNCIIEDDVKIGSDTFIDSNTIIRSYTMIGYNSFIGSNCIIGEYWMDFCIDKRNHMHTLNIGNNALIRSGSIIYAGSNIGSDFQSGHQVTIREKSNIGNHVSVGTLSDIQGNCNIGNYVRMHSNVHIGQHSQIDNFVWIFPYVVLTNDPMPPSENLEGVHIKNFAVIATGSIILPGIEIESDSLIGAGSIVTKPVDKYAVLVGNPAKKIGDVRNLKNKHTGMSAYPWRDNFKRAMPWSDSDFSTWYESLNVTEKRYYKLEN